MQCSYTMAQPVRQPKQCNTFLVSGYQNLNMRLIIENTLKYCRKVIILLIQMQKRRFGFLSKGELYDSRFWRMVENSKIKGTVKTIYWSWDRKELAVRWNRMGKIVQ
jgi:signal peptidase I